MDSNISQYFIMPCTEQAFIKHFLEKRKINTSLTCLSRYWESRNQIPRKAQGPTVPWPGVPMVTQCYTAKPEEAVLTRCQSKLELEIPSKLL